MADSKVESPRLGWIGESSSTRVAQSLILTGLGSMGLAMAMNLQSHLRSRGEAPLNYTNRTMSRGVDLQALGASPCESIAEVVAKSDLVFSSVRLLWFKFFYRI